MCRFLAVSSVCQYLRLGCCLDNTSAITVSGSPAANSSTPLLESFVSYSIEFAFFPDFAGNSSSPNVFSNNLLNNLGDLAGTKPYIRVGGNTQDYALYNASLETAIYGIYNDTRSPDYPTTIHIGPSYFDSYSTFTDTKFIHGFNLALGGSPTNNTVGWQTLLDTVPLACKALSNGKLLWWEYGNEPDLYSTSSQGPVRPPTWNESTYVAEWLNGTRAIKQEVAKACPELAGNDSFGFYAPSFGGVNNHLKPVLTWNDGLDVDGDVKLFSSHNYINGAMSPGVTLQGTLMNHSQTVTSVNNQRAVLNQLAYTGIPFILGETNSLYNQGKPGLSNSFGAALWGLDFNLYSASIGIKRVHMHMGTDYRYAAWQPISTNETTIGTKPPYYGSIAVAAMLGDLTRRDVQVVNLPLSSPFEAAYATYINTTLARIAVINMHQYNYTINGTTSLPNPVQRPSKKYVFTVPEYCNNYVEVKRLAANGSDAITGITWDGLSYNWELKEGKPVRLGNVTIGERVGVERNAEWGERRVSVQVEDSSAAILEFVRR